MGCSDNNSQKDAGNATLINKSVNDSSWTSKLSVALNIPKIHNGVDSFELRLWSSLSMTDLQLLTTLRYSDGQWHCTESRYWIGKIDEWGKNGFPLADSVQTKKLFSMIPYESILDSLRSYNLWNKPSQHDIPNFVDNTADGMAYTLEIAGNEKFHSITYRNPQAYSDPFNRQFYSLLKFLSNSIGAFVIP